MPGTTRAVRSAAFGILACLALGCSAKPSAGEKDAAAADARDAALAHVDAGPTIEDGAMPQGVEELTFRMRHLVEALAQNNPDLAGDVVFPRDAYVAVRDTNDPQKAWETKLARSFKKAVERTHKRTKGIEQAKFISFELGRNIEQTTPKHHDMKKPLYRVKHSKLTFAIDGKSHNITIAEMISWRGAWYVTRLR